MLIFAIVTIVQNVSIIQEKKSVKIQDFVNILIAANKLDLKVLVFLYVGVNLRKKNGVILVFGMEKNVMILS